jgi:hypothetical protein
VTGCCGTAVADEEKAFRRDEVRQSKTMSEI